MSLLSICQQVCWDLGISAPGTIVGNNDETALRLLAAARYEGRNLARRPQNGWLSLVTEYEFTTAAVAQQSGTVANSGPNGTAVISGLSGISAVTAGSWYGFGTGIPNNSIVTATTSSTVTLNKAANQTGSGQFTFGQSDYPLPVQFGRPVDNTLWDRSRFWSMRGPQSPQQWQLYKSSVIGRASIQRRFRFRQINGAMMLSIDPVPVDNGADLVLEYVSNFWAASSTGTPQLNFQADTDTTLINDGEYLIQLGVRWRTLRRLGMDYSEEMDEYERAVRRALAADGGAAILDMTPPDRLTLIGPWNLPETNFGGVSGT